MTGHKTPSSRRRKGVRLATGFAAAVALGLGLGSSGQAQVAGDGAAAMSPFAAAAPLAGPTFRPGEDAAFEQAFADLPRAINDTAARGGAVDVTEVAPAASSASQTASQSASHLGTGMASFYADRFHGQRTASGEAFDNTALTAAHRTLPFGSLVRVSNPATGASVVVRINDRGPFTRGRTIDVSRAAAEQLGMVRAGHARVELELLGS
jgi:rare lipoprotein A